MVDDPVGCLTDEPLPSDLREREIYWLNWTEQQMRVMQQYEEALLNPF